MSESGLAMAAGGAQARAGAAKIGTGGRLLALGISAGCLGMLGVAAWLTPAAAGHGTHQELGLPPCSWAEAFDKPCMTCGMTTSFAYAAHGDLVDSLLAQPFGFVLAVTTSAMVWGAGSVALTGSTLARAAQRLVGARLLWGSVALLLAAWAYKFVTWQG